MELSEIASISGKGGLFKIIKPTRTGAIIETLDDEKKRMVVGAHSKVSILSDISIYTTDEEGSVMLEEVFKRIHKEFDGDSGLNSNSDPEELKSFLKFILPNYDAERVYVSDIKKLVTWYNLLAEIQPDLLLEKEEKKDKEKEGKKDKKTEGKPKADPKSKGTGDKK